MCCTQRERMIQSCIVIIILMLFLTTIVGKADAAWTDMNEDHQIWNFWGSSATDIIGVGCKGIILHYDGNSEGMWSEMLDTTHYA